MPLRVALLSYRSKPHCGGQGVYVRHLSRELVALGHEVEVFSGQPYPELDAGVRLTKVPSLDLYREPDPFRVPRPAGVPRPRGRRGVPDHVDGRVPRAEDLRHPRRPAAARPGRRLRRRPRQPGAGHRHARDRARSASRSSPRSTTRSPSTAASTWPPRRPGASGSRVRRWYGFLRMQTRVARRARMVLTPSESSKRDIVTDFGVDPGRIRVIPLGVDDGFRPPTAPRAYPAGSWPWPAPTPR